MIDTRDELIIALSEAAEIEHGLLVQYLFAAFSMKRGESEGISPGQQLMLAKWEGVILEVAQQEMSHLATVCNLLAAIGGSPQFGRPNFPQSNRSSFEVGVGRNGGRHRHYPFDFQLEQFNDNSLYRFIISELPKGEPPPIHPEQYNQSASMLFGFQKFFDPIDVYNHVGELYKLIEEGFIQTLSRISEDELFIGAEFTVITDLQSAVAAIEEIIEEGEGATGARKGSHYERFIDLRSELREEQRNDPAFKPARNVALNPQTRFNSDSIGKCTLITHRVTNQLAALFNDVYQTMLIILIQYYSFGGETIDQRKSLEKAARGMMSALIRPIAEMLTEMPMTESEDSLMAGPCFEICRPITLYPLPGKRWHILQERFVEESKKCQNLLAFAGDFPVLTRLSGVHNNLIYILFNLEQSFKAQ